MVEFKVTPENLMMASSLVGTSGLGEGMLVMGPPDAAAQTPAAGAWSQFVENADRALRSVHESVADLSNALSMAARAYQLSDQAGAASLQVHK
jgi:hypothetical protein